MRSCNSPLTGTSSWRGAAVVLHRVNLPFTLTCYGRSDWEFMLCCRMFVTRDYMNHLSHRIINSSYWELKKNARI